MARKRRQKKKMRARQRAQHQQHRPSQRVQEAVAAVHRGELAGALKLASDALAAANDPATDAAARSVAVEAHFRLAAATTIASQRLAHLDAALQLTPDAFRLRYHRAITLWWLGRVAEAVPEFEALAAQDVTRHDVALLAQLARAATAQPGSAQEQSEAEAQTLHLLQSALNGADPTESPVQRADRPGLGEPSALWQTLLDMNEQPEAAPVAQLQAIADALEPSGGSAVVQYYLGVAAMRRGDVKTGQATWQAAAAAGMATPWLAHNRVHLLREQAYALGQEGRWQALIDLLQAHQEAASPDPVLAELLTVAHSHLGYGAAQANDWPTAAHHWQEAASGKVNRHLLQNLALAEEALGRWSAAATSWRQVVRRRPRKPDHPDSLSDAQIAALWGHIADCYKRTDDIDEVLTCLQNALKYAPEDLSLRVQVADVHHRMGRDTAAENELDRLLAIDPQYVPALVRLGSLYTDRWDRDPMPIWRRVLRAEPHHEEAREALAQWYVNQVQGDEYRYGWLDRRRQRSEKEKIALLQEGLDELPGHPALLIELGELHRAMKQPSQARSSFEQAWEAAPQQAHVVGEAIHSLLHVDGGDIVMRRLPSAREMPGLLASFWVDQGQAALRCELGQQWVDLFWQEAQALARERHHGDTPAHVLVRICDAANSVEATDLAAHYEARLRAEYPDSGGVAYLEAYHAAQDRGDHARAIRLLRQAQRTARQANENGIAELAEGVEALLSTPVNPLFDLLNRSGRRRGRNPLLDLLDEIEEEEFHDFRRRR